MARAALIVCEKSNRWAIAWRSVLAGSRLPLVETRTWSDAWRALEEIRCGVVAVELRRGIVEQLARGLVRMRREFPLAGAIVLGEPSLAPCEWALREAGALHFVTSSRDLTPAARLALRFLATAGSPSQDLREAIWDRLPWRRMGGETTPNRALREGESTARPPAADEAQ